MPTTETIKLVLALLIGAALWFGFQTVMGWREAADQNEQRGNQIEATTGIVRDGEKADADRATTDTTVSTGRAQFHQDVEGAKRHEPETAARADRAVPTSVRKAFAKRRQARERLGCLEGECAEGSPADDAPQR